MQGKNEQFSFSSCPATQGLRLISMSLPSGVGTIQYLFFENSNISPGTKVGAMVGHFLLFSWKPCPDDRGTGQLLLSTKSNAPHSHRFGGGGGSQHSPRLGERGGSPIVPGWGVGDYHVSLSQSYQIKSHLNFSLDIQLDFHIKRNNRNIRQQFPSFPSEKHPKNHISFIVTVLYPAPSCWGQIPGITNLAQPQGSKHNDCRNPPRREVEDTENNFLDMCLDLSTYRQVQIQCQERCPKKSWQNGDSVYSSCCLTIDGRCERFYSMPFTNGNRSCSDEVADWDTNNNESWCCANVFPKDVGEYYYWRPDHRKTCTDCDEHLVKRALGDILWCFQGGKVHDLLFSSVPLSCNSRWVSSTFRDIVNTPKVLSGQSCNERDVTLPVNRFISCGASGVAVVRVKFRLRYAQNKPNV